MPRNPYRGRSELDVVMVADAIFILIIVKSNFTIIITVTFNNFVSLHFSRFKFMPALNFFMGNCKILFLCSYIKLFNLNYF